MIARELFQLDQSLAFKMQMRRKKKETGLI